MELFLAHCLGLLWLSLGAARRLASRTADQLLAAALLAWGNLVLTSLLLATAHRLGAASWFFSTSLLLAALTCLLMLRVSPEPPATSPVVEPAGDKPSRWLGGAFVLTLAPLALAVAVIAWTYPPDNAGSLAWHLPRAAYFLGQGGLAHFDAADLRQTHLPFNYDLLQLFGLIYSPALQCLALFNLLAWAAGGIAVHRLCRLGSGGANAALVASWLALTATPVLAQANSTTLELPAGVALLAALVFAGLWRQTRRRRHALLAGLALGLAAGSDLRVALLGVMLGLLSLGWSYRHRRDAGSAANRGAWIVPALLAGAFAAPFAVINFATAANWISTWLDFALHQLPAGPGQGAWSAFVRLGRDPSPPFALNEDTAGFGFTGALFLLGAVVVLVRARRSPGPAAWGAGLGLGWILLTLCLPGWQNFGARDFVPAWLLLAPGVAALLGASRTGLRSAGVLLVLGAALASGWSSVHYLFKHASRPLLPLLGTAARPAAPTVPLLLEHHLTRQSRVNVDTDGVDERLFPFLVLRPHQRITSRHQPDPAAFNLLSRAGLSRNSACVELARRPAYSLVPVPAKRTAGVEFLATVGSGAAARDYFGLVPHAGQTRPINSNRSLLVTLSREPAAAGAPNTRIRVAGLNPEDQARLVVSEEHDDGRKVQLAVFEHDGEATATIGGPFHQLGLRVFDASSGMEIGATALPYEPPAAGTARPIDPSLPTGAGSMFVADVVLDKDPRGISVEGLLPLEGPFPQWDLPYLRWQRESAARITVPPMSPLARLQLSFSVRLQVRRKAALELLFNGRPVQRFRIDSPSSWLDQTVELTPQPGANVLEFRDAPLNDEPDWLGYLELYPDVKAHVADSRLPAEQGARDHYEKHGRAEGRTLPVITKPEPAPDGYYFMYRNLRLEGFKSP